MKKSVKKSLLAVVLAACLIGLLAIPAGAVSAGQVTLNGAGTDGSTEIRVKEGGSATVVYTEEYAAPAGVTMDQGLGSAWIFLKYDSTAMTYNENATCLVGGSPSTLNLNNIYRDATNVVYGKYVNQARLMKAAINNTSFAFVVPFTNVRKTTTLQVNPIEFIGKVSGGGSQPELRYVEPAKTPTIIVQYPVTVQVGNGGTVSTRTTAYVGSEQTYNKDGSTTTTATAGSSKTIYADSGSDQQNQPVFNVTPSANFALSSIKVNGVAEPAGTVLNARESGRYTLTNPVTASTTVEFAFSKSVSYVNCTTNTVTGGVSSNSTTGGSIIYNGSNLAPTQRVDVGTTGYQQFSISPKAGYQIKSLTVDGAVLSGYAGKTDERDYSLNVSDLTVDHTIVAEFERISYNITTTVEGPGTISGPATVSAGDSPSYTFTPNSSAYMVKEVWVDGIKLTTVPTSYSFPAVSGNHTLSVVFGAAVNSFEFSNDLPTEVVNGETIGYITLRGKWANETSKDLLQYVSINDGPATADNVTIAADTNSVVNVYGFSRNISCATLDASRFGTVNAERSGILNFVITAKADPTKKLTIAVIVPGDANRDGNVNTSDVTRCIDVAAGDAAIDSRPFSIQLMDTISSGKINTADVTALIDLALEDTVIS